MTFILLTLCCKFMYLHLASDPVKLVMSCILGSQLTTLVL